MVEKHERVISLEKIKKYCEQTEVTENSVFSLSDLLKSQYKIPRITHTQACPSIHYVRVCHKTAYLRGKC